MGGGGGGRPGPENVVQGLLSLDPEVPQQVLSLCPAWAFLGSPRPLRGRRWLLGSITSGSPFPAPAMRGRVGVREWKGREVTGARGREVASMAGDGGVRAGQAGMAAAPTSRLGWAAGWTLPCEHGGCRHKVPMVSGDQQGPLGPRALVHEHLLVLPVSGGHELVPLSRWGALNR